jgi:hypothetical protein
MLLEPEPESWKLIRGGRFSAGKRAWTSSDSICPERKIFCNALKDPIAT